MIDKEYIVYFEIFGKKMKTIITAPNKKGVKKAVKDRIIFHKVVEKDVDFLDENAKGFVGNDETFKNLMNIFGMKK